MVVSGNRFEQTPNGESAADNTCECCRVPSKIATMCRNVSIASLKTDDRHSSNRAVPARQEIVAFYGQDDRRGPEQPPSPAFWLDFPVGRCNDIS